MSSTINLYLRDHISWYKTSLVAATQCSIPSGAVTPTIAASLAHLEVLSEFIQEFTVLQNSIAQAIADHDSVTKSLLALPISAPSSTISSSSSVNHLHKGEHVRAFISPFLHSLCQFGSIPLRAREKNEYLRILKSLLANKKHDFNHLHHHRHQRFHLHQRQNL